VGVGLSNFEAAPPEPAAPELFDQGGAGSSQKCEL
jgi:hypothetical protein